MKSLDLNTLVIIIAVISTLFGFLMLIFSRINPTIKGPMHWSLGSFAIVVASLLFSLQSIDGYIVYVISGSFAVLGMVLYWAGIRAFKEEAVNYYILCGFVLFQLFFGSLFYSVFDMPNARMVSYSSIVIVIYILSIRELRRPAKKEYKLAFNITLSVFVISILTSLFRIYFIVTTLPGDAHNPSLANLLVYFFVNFTQVMLIFSFMMMVSLKIAEKLKLKVDAQNKFFSIISHDLIGPVGLINEILNLANNDKDLAEEQRNTILKEVEGLSASTKNLLQNLLFWSRNHIEDMTPELGKFDLNEIIEENIKLFQPVAKKKEIQVDYLADQNLNCFGDLRMIDTVVRNLISNSIKFTGSGGRIHISTKNMETSIQLMIADNGIGMNKLTMNNLFNFNQIASKSGTNGERGTGLGLLLCKELVEKNNGKLTISSQEKIGTEVTVILPSE